MFALSWTLGGLIAPNCVLENGLNQTASTQFSPMSNWSNFQYTNHTTDTQLETSTNLYTVITRIPG